MIARDVTLRLITHREDPFGSKRLVSIHFLSSIAGRTAEPRMDLDSEAC